MRQAQAPWEALSYDLLFIVEETEDQGDSDLPKVTQQRERGHRWRRWTAP